MRPSIPAFAATDPDIYERFMGRWSARMADPFLSFAGVESGQRVLDVGCGTGIITLALAQRGCTAVGIDASEAYLAGARHRRSHPAITYEHGDAQSLAHATAFVRCQCFAVGYRRDSGTRKSRDRDAARDAAGRRGRMRHS